MLVPFGILQREIVAKSLRPLRVVMYRRFMMRIAAELARKVGATVLVSGESLGPGGVADAGKHDGDPEGDADADSAAAGRDGQERDHRRGAQAGDFRDLDTSRRGLLHAVHPAASGDPRADRGSRGSRNRASRSIGWSTTRCADRSRAVLVSDREPSNVAPNMRQSCLGRRASAYGNSTQDRGNRSRRLRCRDQNRRCSTSTRGCWASSRNGASSRSD